MTDSEKLLEIENEMCVMLSTIKFKSPVEYVYNPLIYAQNLHKAFIYKYFENCTKKILFLGLNPGPWGMCQTGIVFGEGTYVKEWLQITGSVDKPAKEHPKKKITGLDCHRSEVSGQKFWGLFKKICGSPENFFKHAFIYNHCCLAFMEKSGKNITPPEIKDQNVKKQLYSVCNKTLIKIIQEFNFEIVIGIGKFAEKHAITTLRNNGLASVKVFSIPHPSPRNAKNFSNWEQTTLNKLKQHKLLKYFNINDETFKEF